MGSNRLLSQPAFLVSTGSLHHLDLANLFPQPSLLHSLHSSSSVSAQLLLLSTVIVFYDGRKEKKSPSSRIVVGVCSHEIAFTVTVAAGAAAAARLSISAPDATSVLVTVVSSGEKQVCWLSNNVASGLANNACAEDFSKAPKKVSSNCRGQICFAHQSCKHETRLGSRYLSQHAHRRVGGGGAVSAEPANPELLPQSLQWQFQTLWVECMRPSVQAPLCLPATITSVLWTKA